MTTEVLNPQVSTYHQGQGRLLPKTYYTKCQDVIDPGRKTRLDRATTILERAVSLSSFITTPTLPELAPATNFLLEKLPEYICSQDPLSSLTDTPFLNALRTATTAMKASHLPHHSPVSWEQGDNPPTIRQQIEWCLFTLMQPHTGNRDATATALSILDATISRSVFALEGIEYPFMPTSYTYLQLGYIFMTLKQLSEPVHGNANLKALEESAQFLYFLRNGVMTYPPFEGSSALESSALARLLDELLNCLENEVVVNLLERTNDSPECAIGEVSAHSSLLKFRACLSEVARAFNIRAEDTQLPSPRAILDELYRTLEGDLALFREHLPGTVIFGRVKSLAALVAKINREKLLDQVHPRRSTTEDPRKIATTSMVPQIQGAIAAVQNPSEHYIADVVGITIVAPVTAADRPPGELVQRILPPDISILYEDHRKWHRKGFRFSQLWYTRPGTTSIHELRIVHPDSLSLEHRTHLRYKTLEQTVRFFTKGKPPSAEQTSLTEGDNRRRQQLMLLKAIIGLSMLPESPISPLYVHLLDLVHKKIDPSITIEVIAKILGMEIPETIRQQILDRLDGESLMGIMRPQRHGRQKGRSRISRRALERHLGTDVENNTCIIAHTLRRVVSRLSKTQTAVTEDNPSGQTSFPTAEDFLREFLTRAWTADTTLHISGWPHQTKPPHIGGDSAALATIITTIDSPFSQGQRSRVKHLLSEIVLTDRVDAPPIPDEDLLKVILGAAILLHGLEDELDPQKIMRVLASNRTLERIDPPLLVTSMFHKLLGNS